MVRWVSILIYKADNLRLIPELSQVKRKNQYKLSTKSADFIPAVATVISLSPLCPPSTVLHKIMKFIILSVP